MTSILSNAAAAVSDTVKSAIYTKPKEPEDWLSYQDVEKPVEGEEAKMFVAPLYRKGDRVEGFRAGR